MIKRYFYRCPVEAALMAKHHKIDLIGEDGCGWANYAWDLLYEAIPRFYKNGDEYTGNYYVTPDSLPLLQPMVGDVMVGNGILCVAPFMVDYHMLNKPSELETRLLRGKIILRNNLPFITPESEEV